LQQRSESEKGPWGSKGVRSTIVKRMRTGYRNSVDRSRVTSNDRKKLVNTPEGGKRRLTILRDEGLDDPN